MTKKGCHHFEVTGKFLATPILTLSTMSKCHDLLTYLLSYCVLKRQNSVASQEFIVALYMSRQNHNET